MEPILNTPQSLLEIRQDGLPHGRYNKIQLVPLGEYIPFDPILGLVINRLSPLDSYMIPGDVDQTLFTTSVWNGHCWDFATSQSNSRFFSGIRPVMVGEFIITAFQQRSLSPLDDGAAPRPWMCSGGGGARPLGHSRYQYRAVGVGR